MRTQVIVSGSVQRCVRHGDYMMVQIQDDGPVGRPGPVGVPPPPSLGVRWQLRVPMVVWDQVRDQVRETSHTLGWRGWATRHGSEVHVYVLDVVRTEPLLALKHRPAATQPADQAQ